MGTCFRTRCRCGCAHPAAGDAWLSHRSARSPSWCARGGPDGCPARVCGPSRSERPWWRRWRRQRPCRPSSSWPGTWGGNPRRRWHRGHGLPSWATCGPCPDAVSRPSCTPSPAVSSPRGSPSIRGGPSSAFGGPSSGRTGSARSWPSCRARRAGGRARRTWWWRSPSRPSRRRGPGRSEAGAGPGRGRRTSRTSAQDCPGRRAPTTARPAVPATTPPPRRCRPPGAGGRPSTGTRAWCS